LKDNDLQRKKSKNTEKTRKKVLFFWSEPRVFLPKHALFLKRILQVAAVVRVSNYGLCSFGGDLRLAGAFRCAGSASKRWPGRVCLFLVSQLWLRLTHVVVRACCDDEEDNDYYVCKH
jgi:hypothetical protein